MEAKHPTVSYVQFVESFNHGLKILVRDLIKRYPTDSVVFRAHKRVMTIIAIDPLFAINEVGPYLYSYRNQIYNLDQETIESFFFESDFDEELKASVDQEKADMVSYIIPKAKECARSLPPAEKKEYRELVVSLLDDYIEYLATKPH